MRASVVIPAVLLCMSPLKLVAQASAEPIIDVHLHAAPALRPDAPPQPLLDALVPAQPTDQAVMDSTLAIMKRMGVVRAALSGAPNRMTRWMNAAPDRFIGGVVLVTASMPIDSLRAMHAAGRLGVMGEIQPIYVGKSPADSSLEPYYALAEELGIPAGVHMQAGGARNPAIRVTMANPLLLEEVLVRHPRLRLYMMHGGYPFLAETIAILRTYPNVYVDVSFIDWGIPTEEFHAYLQGLVRAGFAQRIMFGSDANARPHAIIRAVNSINAAPFLTAAQKRDILYGNAVRFFRLDLN